GPRVAAVWSDAREDLTLGFGDVYLTVVSGKSPDKALVPERVVVKSKLHSHGPVVAGRSDGTMLVSWIEDDPQATELLALTGKPDWGAYVVRLDASGMASQGATQVPIDPQVGKGIVSNVAVDCAAQGSVTAASCRLVLAFSDREGIAMLGAVA